MSRPAAKQGDQVVAVDTHIIVPVIVPVPLGAPTSITLPFNGTITTNLSRDVFIEGKPAATVGSGAVNMTPHVVPPPAGFPKPPSNRGKILTGSTGVFINGKPAARLGDQAITCNDPVDLPKGTVVRVPPVGRVFIGETGAGYPAPPPPPEPPPPKLQTAKWGQPGSIISADWEKSKVKIGDEVKMIANVRDFEDGTPAKFLVWERKGSQDTIMKEIEGEVRGNKAEKTWKHEFKDGEEELREKVEEEEEEPEYYFVVDVEGEEERSEALKFTYPLDIYLEDEVGNPLDDVEYKITLSDGTEKKGKFKDGHAKIEDAPYGRFVVEVEGYEFVFE